MAHRSQLEYIHFLKQLFPDFYLNKRVLEIGSLDISGSIRQFFESCEYVGMDVAPGKGVDVVCQGQDYDAPDASFDVVISCEVMEHNPYWADTVRNMVRLCKPNGMVVITCATLGRAEHGTARSSPDSSPLTVSLGWNYYKNLTKRDFESSDALDSLNYRAYAFQWYSNDLYFVGFKSKVVPDIDVRLSKLRKKYRKLLTSKWSHLRRYLKAQILRRRDGGYQKRPRKLGL